MSNIGKYVLCTYLNTIMFDIYVCYTSEERHPYPYFDYLLAVDLLPNPIWRKGDLILTHFTVQPRVTSSTTTTVAIDVVLAC